MRTGMTRYRKFSPSSALKMPGFMDDYTSRNTLSVLTEDSPSKT